MSNNVSFNALSSGNSSSAGGSQPEQPWVSELMSKANVSRFKKQLLENCISKAETSEIESRIVEIRNLISSFEGSDFLILPHADNISHIIDDATSTCNLIEAAMKISPSNQRTSHPDEDYGHTEENAGIKLKALKYPIYYGDEESWLPFWEQYEASVHNRKIPDATKHRILIDECLKGEALKSIKGINPNSRNYQTSITVLKSRFGDPVKLASFYYMKLESLPGSNDTKEQLSTYEEVNKILANLASLEVDTDERFLREKIIPKFNSSTLMWVWAVLEGNESSEEKRSGSVVARVSVHQLMAAIGKVVNRRRDIQHYFRNEPVVPKPKKSTKGGNGANGALPTMAGPSATPESQLQSGPACIFCTRKHDSKDCKKYRTLKKRRERLVEKRKCLMCGGAKHRAASCPHTDPCEHCGKPKHTILTCVEYMKSKDNSSKNSKGKSSSNSFDKSLVTDLTGTFIETFSCKIKDLNGKYVNIKGMLDGGSCLLFITNNVVNKLGLKKGKESLSRVCQFGSNKAICQRSNEVVVTFKNNKSEIKSFCLKTMLCYHVKKLLRVSFYKSRRSRM